MPFSFAPHSRRPFSRLVDLPLATTLASGAGAVVIYTLELFPATGSPIYVATEVYNSFPTDSKPSTPFAGVLDKPPRFRRSIKTGDGFGGVASGVGEAEINNASGDYDSVLAAPLDGARAIFKLGWRDISYDRFITLADTTVEKATADIESIIVQFHDDNARLDIPAQPNSYGGTGGIDGDSNAKGKRKPIILGTPPNVTLQLIDAANLVYQGHDGAMGGWAHIYDRAIELTVNATPDYPNYAALIAAPITAGRWASCNALGVVRLGAKPDGTLTGTPSGGAVSNGLVAGSPTAGTALTDTASLVHYLLTITSANIVVDAGSVIATKAAAPAPIGYFIGPDDTRTLRQVVDELMGGTQGGIGGFATFRRDRTLELGIFALPTGQPAGEYTQQDWFGLTRVPLPSGIEPPPWRIRAAYSLNWTIQPDVDVAVDASTQTLRKDPHSIATSTDTATSDAIRLAHPRAKDPDVRKTFYVNASDAIAFCNAQLTLLGGAARSLYRISLPTAAFASTMAGVIKITDESADPRFGLQVGKSLTVVEIDDNTDEAEVEVEGFG